MKVSSTTVQTICSCNRNEWQVLPSIVHAMSYLPALQVKFGLSTENLRAYVGMIAEETNGFLTNELHASSTKWQGFDALHAMSELTILTASRTLQGKEVRAGLDKTFAKRYEDLDGGFTPINFMFPKLPLPSYRRRDKAQKAMSEFYQGIIRKRREGTHDVSLSATSVWTCSLTFV